MTGANLKPWPEQGEAITTLGAWVDADDEVLVGGVGVEADLHIAHRAEGRGHVVAEEVERGLLVAGARGARVGVGVNGGEGRVVGELEALPAGAVGGDREAVIDGGSVEGEGPAGEAARAEGEGGGIGRVDPAEGLAGDGDVEGRSLRAGGRKELGHPSAACEDEPFGGIRRRRGAHPNAPAVGLPVEDGLVGVELGPVCACEREVGFDGAVGVEEASGRVVDSD